MSSPYTIATPQCTLTRLLQRSSDAPRTNGTLLCRCYHTLLCCAHLTSAPSCCCSTQVAAAKVLFLLLLRLLMAATSIHTAAAAAAAASALCSVCASCCLCCQVCLLFCLQLCILLVQLGDVKVLPGWVHGLQVQARGKRSQHKHSTGAWQQSGVFLPFCMRMHPNTSTTLRL